MATDTTLQRSTARLCIALSLVVATLVLASSAAAESHESDIHTPDVPTATTSWTYGWPVKPFFRQHPVRGMFGDPRIGRADDGSVSRQFHFGIDVSAPNGTAVYATQTGTVVLLNPNVVTVIAGKREFSYWHIAPAVHDGDHAVAYRTVVGHILKPWAHVHFSEEVDRVYLNPLRPGALGPYVDTTRPTVASIRAVRGPEDEIDLVARVYDKTPLPVAAPWTGKPVMPELVRWRLRGNGLSTRWHTALDVHRTIPDRSQFFSVYTEDTRQNQASVRGRYVLYLARHVEPGRYAIEVEASDGHGNTTRKTARLTVRPPSDDPV